MVAGTHEVETQWWLCSGSQRAMVPIVIYGMGFVTAMRCGWRGTVKGSIGGLVW